MLFGLTGCSSGYFLYQAGKGQLRILNRARPVEEVIADPRTHRDLAGLLTRIPEIRRFGEAEGLRPTSNYREYVALDQEAVVYVVTVSEPLAMKPRIFRFPLVGSFNYLGWFDRADAEEFAGKFEREGADVDVRGASAFSTLGWFRDPLLSTMIPMREGRTGPTALAELVNVFLHESVHATLYIANQSYFNESLASFVADRLTRKYFESHTDADPASYTKWLEHQERWEKVRARMSRGYRDLETIYRADVGAEEKRRRKSAYLEALQEELKYPRRITNATLIQFRTYDPSDRGFGDLLDRCGGDLARFLGVLSKLREQDFPGGQAEDWSALLSVLAHANE